MGIISHLISIKLKKENAFVETELGENLAEYLYCYVTLNKKLFKFFHISFIFFNLFFKITNGRVGKNIFNFKNTALYRKDSFNWILAF